ncbi:MAG TPA: GNAT family protein [Actinospica sp.]|jgi:RimJ/RimL family protein N-acetyltransferase|nr:GNAT family protein [Actinospica sp.]
METPDLVLEPVRIVTERYLLRPPSLREAGDVLAMSRDPEIRLWNPMTSVTDEESAQAWCRKWGDWDGGTSAVWCVFETTEDKLLGAFSLYDVDTENSSAELGYRVAPWARGQGVGTAALRAVSDWALFGTLDLTRLQLLHGLENVASCRVAEKSGFVLEGTLRSSYRYGDGQLHAEHLHGRLASDSVPS